jgi:hypothetical protein
MSQKTYLCTTLDVRNLSEYITTEVRDDARVQQYMMRADAILRDTLRPLYTIDTDLNESAPWNGPPQVPFAVPDQSIDANSDDGALSDITVSTAAITETLTITFTSSSAFGVVGSVTGSLGTGTTGGEHTSGYLTIPAANWSGTFASGDIVYVSVYKAKPLIITLSALLSAGLMLKSTYQGIGISEMGKEYWEQGQDLLKKLQKPYTDEGLQLDSFSARDISPQGVSYAVDVLGRDVSKYADNELTPWTDSTTGGGLFEFFGGPVWIR